MNCRDCNKELGEKFVKYSTFINGKEYIDGVCFECAETNYNDYNKCDGKERGFCEKCGEKFLTDDLIPVTIKRVRSLVCRTCGEDF